MSFSGAIVDKGGIILVNNPGTAFQFTGGLDIDSTSNPGFSADLYADLVVCGSNTVDTTSGQVSSS